MATITGITAAKADEILGMSVVSGAINGSGHLILTRGNGSTIDAGDFTGIVSSILGDQVQAKVDDVVPDAIAGTVVDKGSVGGTSSVALTIPELNSDNMPNAMVKVTLAGNVTFAASSLPAAPKANTQWVLRLQQDATGSRVFTISGFKRAYGSLPISTTPNAVDLIVFIFDGTDWLVGLMGADFK